MKIRRQHNADHIQYRNGNFFEKNPLAGEDLQQNKTEQDQTPECHTGKDYELDFEEIKGHAQTKASQDEQNDRQYLKMLLVKSMSGCTGSLLYLPGIEQMIESIDTPHRQRKKQV